MSESVDQRSRTMRAVKGRDTAPELAVRKLLHARGYRYRLHRADLPGCPDIVFPCRRKVIFVNGCFWHGHPCRRGSRTPTRNRDYWERKILRNAKRDARVLAELKDAGWQAQVIWECELRESTSAILEVCQCFLGTPSRGERMAAKGGISPRTTAV